MLAACRAAGFTPSLGRAACSMEDGIVEIGLAERAAAVVHSCGAGDAAGVAVRPLDPPVEMPGYLLVRADGPPDCLAALVDAFG